MVKVSYLMTVYNDEENIDNSIISIINQTYKNIEIIIVNDGSNDGTCEKIKKYLVDPRIIFINRKENRGRVYSLNEGLDIAKGDLLFINDSDDVSMPDRTRTIVDYYCNNYKKSIGMIFSSSLTIRENGNIQVNEYKQGFFVGKKRGKIFKYKLLMQNYIVHSSVAYVTDALKEIGGFSTEVTSGIDYLTYLKLLKHHEIHGLKEVLVERKIHGKNFFLINSKKEDKTIRQQWIKDNFAFGFFYNYLFNILESISSYCSGRFEK